MNTIYPLNVAIKYKWVEWWWGDDWMSINDVITINQKANSMRLSKEQKRFFPIQLDILFLSLSLSHSSVSNQNGYQPVVM